MSRRAATSRAGMFRLLFLALLLAGCAGTGTVPEERYYRLATLDVGAPFEQPPLAGVLYVERIEAVSLFRDRALLYGAADRPQQLQRHHYHYWAGSPPLLVRDQLVQYLRDRGLAERVTTEPMGRTPVLRLRLELRDFSRRLHGNGQAAVRVELGLAVHPANGAPPLLVRRYVREQVAANGSPAAAVTAFDRALAEVYGEMVEDLLPRVAQR